MRATEQARFRPSESLPVHTILEAVRELRRRGDALVRVRDLELVVPAVNREQITLGEDEAHALNHLDGALDGASLWWRGDERQLLSCWRSQRWYWARWRSTPTSPRERLGAP